MTVTGYKILDSVGMSMRDGTILRADIWLPGEGGQWPVLLQRTAYRKEDAFGTQYISALEFMAALRRGYAIVIQDTRGRYSSDGTFVPFVHEAEDGADTIAWLRDQPFCNGQVMMFGGSYVGATQVLAASAHPKGLTAISPHLTTGRHGDSWTYRGGAIELGFLLLWIIESLGAEDLRHRLDAMPPAEAEQVQRALAELQRDPHAAFARLPVLDDDLLALAPYAATWFDAERAAAAHSDREHLDALATSQVPFLVSAGWNDLFLEGALELFQTVRGRWNRPEDVPDRLILGPWSHGNPTDWQGDGWLGYAASTASLPNEQLAFFDAARAGRIPDTPMVRYFRSGSNTWHSAPDWPLPGTTRRELLLADDALAASLPTAWERSYISDSLNPVPTVGGANFVPGLLQGRNSGPKVQTAIESRADVLVFTSPPLESDMDVTGLVELVFWASSTAPTCDWTARLCEVDQRDISIGLVDGIVRQASCTVEPGEISLRLGHISHLFRRGNSIRLQLASSNFPRFDRNPQSRIPSTRATAQDFRPATQTVVGGGDRPSRLILPVP
ncbi:MAG: esterase [Pelagibacterium sp. SCN 64-44]|nr:MAG: esterase [Pelagibacterium sp. SCN 64-44]